MASKVLSLSCLSDSQCTLAWIRRLATQCHSKTQRVSDLERVSSLSDNRRVFGPYLVGFQSLPKVVALNMRFLSGCIYVSSVGTHTLCSNSTFRAEGFMAA